MVDNYEGFMGDETESVLGGGVSYSFSYERNGKPSTYTITPSGLTYVHNGSAAAITAAIKAKEITVYEN